MRKHHFWFRVSSAHNESLLLHWPFTSGTLCWGTDMATRIWSQRFMVRWEGFINGKAGWGTFLGSLVLKGGLRGWGRSCRVSLVVGIRAIVTWYWTWGPRTRCLWKNSTKSLLLLYYLLQILALGLYPQLQLSLNLFYFKYAEITTWWVSANFNP